MARMVDLMDERDTATYIATIDARRAATNGASEVGASGVSDGVEPSESWGSMNGELTSPKSAMSLQDALISLEAGSIGGGVDKGSRALMRALFYPDEAPRENTLEHVAIVMRAVHLHSTKRRHLLSALTKPRGELGDLHGGVEKFATAMDEYIYMGDSINWDDMRPETSTTNTPWNSPAWMKVQGLLTPCNHGLEKIDGVKYDLNDNLLRITQLRSHYQFGAATRLIPPREILGDYIQAQAERALATLLNYLGECNALEDGRIWRPLDLLPRMSKQLNATYSKEELRLLCTLGQARPWKEIARGKDGDASSPLEPMLPHLSTMTWEQLIAFAALVEEYNWEWAVASMEWSTR